MAIALLGMGSNIRPTYHLSQAATEIRQRFQSVRFSHVYKSAAVGMDGEDFLNACCLIEGVPAQKDFLLMLKEWEDKYQRDRSRGSWKPRTLDLDLLMLDGNVFDDDLYRYAHVFIPASELLQLKKPSIKFNQITRLALCL